MIFNCLIDVKPNDFIEHLIFHLKWVIDFQSFNHHFTQHSYNKYPFFFDHFFASSHDDSREKPWNSVRFPQQSSIISFPTRYPLVISQSYWTYQMFIMFIWFTCLRWVIFHSYVSHQRVYTYCLPGRLALLPKRQAGDAANLILDVAQKMKNSEASRGCAWIIWLWTVVNGGSYGYHVFWLVVWNIWIIFPLILGF